VCGVAGILNLDGSPASEVILRRMTEVLAHRGPDGEGVYVDGAVGLGHRRLAIIDLSPAGHQPMTARQGRYVISYSGEVYNFQALRVQLEALGHQFHSRTDAEVVLHAWIEWGLESLDRLNGMFAFALWDGQERRLTLVRDRYGVKPLYYTRQGATVLFGSEIKAILAHPAYAARMDAEALVEYLTFQNLFTDRTLFEGVRLLPAGTVLEIAADAAAPLRPRRYWDYHFDSPDAQAGDEREYLEELDRLFRQAVTRQLVSDVEIGSYLSGGMDSGSITAIAASQWPYIKTFTCGFDLHSASGLELGFDERAKAEFMSFLFKTEHYEMVLKAGDMERVMGRLTRHLEDPRVGQSYPNFYAAQLAGKFVKVVLSGAGGDELFGGYPWRYYRAADSSDFDEYIDKYYDFWQRLVPADTAERLFAPIRDEVKDVRTRDIFRGVFSEEHASRLQSPADYVNHSLYFEAKTFLHGLLLVEDKLSMAHGLETRVPFLDNDLVAFAMRVPVRMKLGGLQRVIARNENEPGPKTEQYYRRTRDGKLLLRKAMQRHIPEAVTRRIKQGFSAPDASWFRGESLDYVRRLLFEGAPRLYDWLDRTTVQALVNEHLEGRHNRRLLIWSLLSLEHWCKEFL